MINDLEVKTTACFILVVEKVYYLINYKMQDGIFKRLYEDKVELSTLLVSSFSMIFHVLL